MWICHRIVDGGYFCSLRYYESIEDSRMEDSPRHAISCRVLRKDLGDSDTRDVNMSHRIFVTSGGGGVM